MKYLLLATLALLWTAAANAACPALPSWALSWSDQTNCYMNVDGGGSHGTIQFTYKLSTTPTSCGGSGMAEFDSGSAANGVMYDSTLDGYEDNNCQSLGRLLRIIDRPATRFTLFRNVKVGNNWGCDGSGWSNPGLGLSCTGDTTGSEHLDIIERYDSPTNGEWNVWQDVELVNTDSQIGYPTSSGSTQAAGVVWQGGKWGGQAAWGLATNYFTDCNGGGRDVQLGCDHGKQIFLTSDTLTSGSAMPYYWLIGVTSTSQANLNVRLEKGDNITNMIIVTGSAAVVSGRPQPLSQGPTGCPDGSMGGWTDFGGSGSVVNQYCYHWIEQALAAGHPRPPFIALSDVGWQTPPSGGSTPPPTLLGVGGTGFRVSILNYLSRVLGRQSFSPFTEAEIRR